jgi:hypothetical protein
MYDHGMNAATVRELGNIVGCVEIVQRRTGAGFRLVLHMRTRHDTPVIETCSTIFATLRDAEAYANREYGAVS